MSGKILRPKTIEVGLSVANTVYGNVLIRCFNNSAAVAVVTLANTGGTISNTSVASYKDIILRKQPTDTLTGAAFTATAIAFTD